jgi:hypothetical protein
MSMNATFVQVDQAELSRLRADPTLAEALFVPESAASPVWANLSKLMQDRMRSNGPQLTNGHRTFTARSGVAGRD